MVRKKQTYTLNHILELSNRKGYNASSFKLQFDSLTLLHVPVIVYLHFAGRSHFSVLRGIGDTSVLLADPSLGNSILAKSRFIRLWKQKDGYGRIRILFPKENKTINASYFAAPRRNPLLERIPKHTQW